MAKVKTVVKSPTLKIRPLAGYLVVEPSGAETQTASGIYLPETAQEKPAQGTVLAVGAPFYDMGREILPPVQVGDKVIYKKWGSEDIKVGGVEYKLVKVDDLMAIVED